MDRAVSTRPSRLVLPNHSCRSEAALIARAAGACASAGRHFSLHGHRAAALRRHDAVCLMNRIVPD